MSDDRVEVEIRGVLDPERVTMLGVWIAEGGYLPEVITLSKIQGFAGGLSSPLAGDLAGLKYRQVSSKEVWFNFRENVLRVGNRTLIGLDYFKRAVDFFRVVAGMTATWKKALQDGIIDFYVGPDEYSPVLLVYDDYAALIGPRLPDEDGGGDSDE
ncbi:hypothetical protein X802_01015 [Thermococcus guaymasensis DSM 11113]|uniref:Uncharacterized protein n=1 Tax=Thermococcus guaymasensis DSM 11113 TaxID=1432656 RepID=A0A0X1KMW9_9EURY|nr:hypothetical protein [Thermococcus guaymasensis]AJC72632.1 hypothetical protein X802_01015 [Thermococcus guaymasensis DSM 11113]